MDWEEALIEAIERGGDRAYHPLATLTFGTDRFPTAYAITTWRGTQEGLQVEQVSIVLDGIGANDDNWDYE